MHFEQITIENPVLAQMAVRGEGAAWRITAAKQQCLAEYSAIPLTEDTYWLSRGTIVALHERTASPELQQWLVAIDHLWVVNGKTLHDADGIIYGVLNVSPESFYNGDQVADVDTMVARAGEMLAKGADVIEVGGQTTKPGFEAAGLELTPTAEIDRIAPVITGIKAHYPDAVIAVDTYKYDVMVRAVALGVDIINDVNGFLDDPRKAPFLADHQVGLLTMWNPRGETVVNLQAEMHAWFEDNLAQLTAAGIARQRIALDPGVGYAKNSDVAQDLAMMNTIGHLQDLQRPIMTAVSNKGWAKFLLGLPKLARADVSLVAATEMFQRGARILRVHDVQSAKQMTQVVRAIAQSFWQK